MTNSAAPEPADGVPADVVAAEMAHEQQHVNAVYDQLGITRASAKNQVAAGGEIFRSDRETWVREEDGTALFERDAFAYQAARRLSVLDAEHEGLVFGRLDGAAHEAPQYIGRIGVRDDDYEPLVVDWRAPAAEPFYRATPQHPMGVVRRRVLRCRADRVVGIEDDLLDTNAPHEHLPIIGEGALMAALSRSRGRHMRDIVATIQGEQDEAIRSDYRGVTTITGGPGTGKTVVALHRAAYLLYSNRRKFERGGILVVGPGPVFMNYIERVLPSLGEDSVVLRAIADVPIDVLPRLRATRVDDAAAAAIKGSLRMVPVLRALVNLPLTTARLELRTTVKGNVLKLDERQLVHLRDGILAHTLLNKARPAAEKALLRALRPQVPADVDLSADEIDELITSSQSYRAFFAAWWPTLEPADVLRRLGDLDVAHQVAGGRLKAREIETLSRSYAQHRDFSVADTALLDELAAILGPVPADPDADPTLFLTSGAQVSELVTTADVLSRQREADADEPEPRTYAHVLVDEAQDVTPMQWRMLRRRGAHASWTVVGDLAQSSWPDLAEVSRALSDLIGTAPHREFRLSVNYRSPQEVFELASQVVQAHYPQADLPTAVRSTGVAPRMLTTTGDALVDDLAAQVREAAAQVGGTVGVIAIPERLDALEDAVRARLDVEIEPERLWFMTPLQSKGLEYDAVVVVAPDEIVAGSAGGVRTLYVALTRPTQLLVTLDVGPRRAAWRESLGSPSNG